MALLDGLSGDAPAPRYPLDQQYIDQIKNFEGYSPSAAWDYKQSSSGYGTKAKPGDENLPPDQLKAIHEQRFTDEIAKAAAHVDSVNPNLPPGPRAALISLTYNAGPGWSQSGLGDLVRAGDLEGAKTRLLEYNKAGGKVNEGLVNRRAAEAAWFGGNQPAPAQAAPVKVAQASPASPSSPVPAQQALVQPPQAAEPAQSPAAMPNYFAQMSAEQAAPPPPIFMPQRRPPDISKLRAALQASGNRGFIFS
jgi:lysozyme